MSENTETGSPRMKLVRDVATLQLKLMADGLRDAILIPVSLVAAIIGIFRGGEEPDREFRRVIKMGIRSERWINLFGHQRQLGKESKTGSLDSVLEQAEAVVIEQYKKGRTTDGQRKTDPEKGEKEAES